MPAAHGFFGQDGARPADMTAQARAQLERYPSATFRKATALGARAEDGRFGVTLDTGEELSAAKLVLAFGIIDILPDVPGVAERWGKTVLHCPYCHGYEFGGRKLGVLSTGSLSAHQARIIANWGPTTFFLNGHDEPGQADLEELRTGGVRIERTPVAKLEGEATGLRALQLADRRHVEIDALHVAPGARLASPIAGQLGCVLDDKPSGPLIRVDSSMMTTVPGVYAAGDTVRWAGNAMLAAAADRFGGIDVLVNNAGLVYLGAVEEGEDSEVRKLFEANVFGLAAMLRAALPGMRARGSGTVVNLSSASGLVAYPGLGYYSASKFAVEGLTEALWQEVEPLGIKVILVEPGAFRTGINARSPRAPSNPACAPAAAEMLGFLEAAGDTICRGDPERAAAVLSRAVETGDAPHRLILGSDAYAGVTGKLDAMGAEYAQWKAVSESTDFPA